MTKTLYDYRGFSLRRLNEPRFAHAKLLLGWVVYFCLYFLTENLIPAERCHVVHCALDDVIPFNEWFAIFYVGWFFFVFGSLAFTFFYDVPRFRKMQLFLMGTQAIAMLCYIVYPTVQDLRPETFPRENLLTWVMGFIYAFDTPTGVCPSLHVGYSVGILSVVLKDRELPRWLRAAAAVFVVMVCLAVCFVKQHSAVDVLAAVPMCLAVEAAVYGKDYWLPKFRRKKAE